MGPQHAIAVRLQMQYWTGGINASMDFLTSISERDLIKAQKNREYYIINRERILERIANYQRENLAKILAYQKEYKHKHPEKVSEWSRRSRQRNPERIAMYRKQYDAIHQEQIKAEKFGRMIPLASNCQQCGSSTNLERHHPDYSKPLEITTLCKRCHREIHLEFRTFFGGM